MKLEKGVFSYPVLRPENSDVKGTFENAIERSPNREKDKFVITSKISLSNETLENCLKKGSAVYVLHVECGTTRYRQSFQLKGNVESIEINGGDLDGKVDLNTFIVAAQDFPNYRNAESHEDYRYQSFELQRGQMLALTRRWQFDANKDQEAFRNLSPILQLVKSVEKNPPPIFVDVSQRRKVYIHLPPEDYDICEELLLRGRQATRSGQMKFGANHVIFQTVVMPAVMEIFSRVHRDVESLSDRNWFGALEKGLERAGYKIVGEQRGQFEPLDPDTLVAQTLFEDFLSNALQGLKEYATFKTNRKEADEDD
jgi:hypothetical protein